MLFKKRKKRLKRFLVLFFFVLFVLVAWFLVVSVIDEVTHLPKGASDQTNHSSDSKK
jgi:predicted PurR-regulated permease PerM